DFNALVTQGQVVALIDPALYEAQLEQARALLAGAQAQALEQRMALLAADAALNSARAQQRAAAATSVEAELNYQRFSGLKNQEAVAKANLDTALVKRENALAGLDMAAAQVETAKANRKKVAAQQEGAQALIAQRLAALNLAEIQLRYCTIRSPFAGTVISRHVDVGQTVAASLQSPILFTIAEDLSKMQVEADVSEADVGQIQPQQEVEFTVDAFPEKKFKAQVRQVRNAASNVQNVVTYTIVADVENQALLLRPGMTANVTIIVAEVSDILLVPNAALRFKPATPAASAGRRESVPISERPFYKSAVAEVGLDPGQAEQYAGFIKDAGVKLKEVYTLPEDQRDIIQAWRNFYVEINRKLYTILRDDQYEKFKVYIENFKAQHGKNKSSRKLKSATLYVLNEAGQPESRSVLAGVTDETQTQILSEDLKEGDKVIVGLSFTAGGARKDRSSLFSALWKR
ncbi:MAG: efflux RND transporter periplasmic adaptor subunit, partial [Deltaproteobacteria bacterium]|nr:efflux RND transporter periplasmic adaptor subunit [Deltaproteobacteria bacterium]